MKANPSPIIDEFSGLVRQTPLIAAPGLGDRVWLKLECLQRTGSFKLRGAVRACAALDAGQRSRGVVVASAGNHGAGMALACREAGVALTVCVPKDAPQTKRDRITAMGAEILEGGADYDAAEVVARELARDRGSLFVSPFDDEAVIAGNGGDLAAEIAAQHPGFARIVAPVGGGGLIAGLARALGPGGVEVLGAQPQNNCAMHDSLRIGRALTTYRGLPTVADGCEGAVGALTFDIARCWIDRVALVSEPAIESAVAWLYREMGVISECAGAVGVAAVREGEIAAGDGDTIVVVSGGNIDDQELARILDPRTTGAHSPPASSSKTR